MPDPLADIKAHIPYLGTYELNQLYDQLLQLTLLCSTVLQAREEAATAAQEASE
jgi:hypothetical protein